MMHEKMLTRNRRFAYSIIKARNLLLILVAGLLSAQQTPQQLVDKMGRGINLGNVLSAPVEGNWSGAATEQYFIDVAQAGFKNVRIPIDFFGDRTSGNTSQYSISANTSFTGTRRSHISSFKNSLITVRAYYNNPELVEADRESKRPEMGSIYKEYVDRCFKAGAMDFDDLLLKTNELLNRFPDVLAKYQERFRYILVDEYQDTNHSQYLIVRALADRYQNVCVVGDDAQSIYAFRGANIQNILNFQRDYDDAAVYRLEQNSYLPLLFSNLLSTYLTSLLKR